MDRKDPTMHPRILAKADCSGGTCPAVYDDDPDLLPGELAIVGEKAPAGLAGRLSEHIAPDEAAVTISRELVADALRPAPEVVGGAELQAELETFRHSAFRLETLQHYKGTGRDDSWVALLKANHRWGKTHQRVHVIAEPLSVSMQEELTDGYGPNVAAREDIRIIPVSDELEGWPDDVPYYDFWLFDSSRLLMMNYAATGAWAGAIRVRDPEQIVIACEARDAALHHGISWRSYIASHPDLQRRMAQ